MYCNTPSTGYISSGHLNELAQHSTNTTLWAGKTTQDLHFKHESELHGNGAGRESYLGPLTSLASIEPLDQLAVLGWLDKKAIIHL